MSENKQVLTLEQIRSIADEFDIAIDPGYLNHEFARSIESAVLSARAVEKKDAERLDFMSQHSAFISHSLDGDVCSVWTFDEDGHRIPFRGWPQRSFDSVREAIDDAIRATNSMQSTNKDKP